MSSMLQKIYSFYSAIEVIKAFSLSVVSNFSYSLQKLCDCVTSSVTNQLDL